MTDQDTNRGKRVVDLRELHALTQSELAAAAGIPQPNLSKIERGLLELTPASAHRICQATGTPVQFFDHEPVEMTAADMNFRKAAKVSARGGRLVVQAVREISRVSGVLADAPIKLKRMELPIASDKDIRGRSDVDRWAELVRHTAGLSAVDPVRNVIRTAERAGVAVAPIQVPPDDAPSLLAGHSGMSTSAVRPTICFVTGQSGDRQRFTIAHELGHLLLHTSRSVPVVDREAEAHAFAGALLLPETVAGEHISETLTLQGFMRLKATFGISLQAAIMHGRQLGLLSAQRHRSLMIQISSRGWRKDEPVEVGHESPMLLWTELIATYGNNPYARASSDLGVAPSLLSQWIPDRTTSADEGDVVSLATRRRL
ncbi:ImmA/IrrE family metallo-endopeptidase [Rhodococcus fascians]|nr:ImmA/IrrE family metallo-endopeptidase [Rhodococcus fascians]MBY4239550.1 ImmA/IrrE family metallo-endopeptidase [Rhodococcus fascians]MBY4253718.1 ImmA/IrrE family metallo-endopeptidase [Rhodococcus fascians]MBY4271139.1 ImmA/IrrE family metallo-endopeptidase [Rhodococcus fascians]